MDTISKHRARLLKRYSRSDKAESVIASAKRLAHLLLASNELLEKHRKKMLSEVLWLLSEADGKYSTRYRSAEAIRLAREQPTSMKKIQHEHVWPRKVVIQRILANRQRFLDHPTELDALLDETVGCVVTAGEHADLIDDAEGWARYEQVLVFDMSTEPPVLINAG